jgi:hypothetical protein
MGYCCRIFTPVQPVYPAASVRDFVSGALTAGQTFYEGPQRYSHRWSQREQDDASQVLGVFAQRKRVWPIMTAQWPDYDKYQAGTKRDIPVVLLTPR